MNLGLRHPSLIHMVKFRCAHSASEIKIRSKAWSHKAPPFLVAKIITPTTPGQIFVVRATSALREFMVVTHCLFLTGRMLINLTEPIETKIPAPRTQLSLREDTNRSWYSRFLNQSKPLRIWPPRRNWDRLRIWMETKIRSMLLWFQKASKIWLSL